MSDVMKVSKRLKTCILGKPYRNNLNWGVIGCIAFICSYILLVLSSLMKNDPQNNPQAVVYCFVGIIYMCYPFMLVKIIKQHLKDFFLDTQSAFLKQVWIVVFNFIFTVVYWNIVCGVTIFLNGINFILNTEDLLRLRPLLNFIVATIVLFSPIFIMGNFIKCYKKQVTEQIADCKFLTTWIALLASITPLVIYYFAFFSYGENAADKETIEIAKYIVNIIGPKGLWGFGISLFLFRAVTEYYSLVKDDVKPEELNKVQEEISEEKKMLQQLLKEVQEMKSEVTDVKEKICNVEKQTKNVSKINFEVSALNNRVMILARKIKIVSTDRNGG